eukprot:1000708-Amphidinium_carterae.1
MVKNSFEQRASGRVAAAIMFMPGGRCRHTLSRQESMRYEHKPVSFSLTVGLQNNGQGGSQARCTAEAVKGMRRKLSIWREDLQKAELDHASTIGSIGLFSNGIGSWLLHLPKVGASLPAAVPPLPRMSTCWEYW